MLPEGERRGRGRPRIYPVGVARDGAPLLTMRIPPDLLEWVRARGGSTFVRELLEERRRSEGSCEGGTDESGVAVGS